MHSEIVDRTAASGGDIFRPRSIPPVEQRDDIADSHTRLRAYLHNRVAGRDRSDNRIEILADAHARALGSLAWPPIGVTYRQCRHPHIVFRYISAVVARALSAA